MRHVPSLLAILAVVLASGSFAVVAHAQSSSLPPTNMGKYVHQPGDNQYQPAAQMDRHRPAPVFVPQQQQQAPIQVGYVPAPHIDRPDPTLESIAADEPVVRSGFPPLPDRADLPVASGWGSTAGGGWGASGAGGGGGAAAGGPPQPSSVHQHYQHYEAGAFAPPKQSTPNGHQGYDHQAPPSAQGGPTHGGYNHANSDFYSSSGGGGGSPAQQALNAMGKEPKLNGRADAGIVPEAPTPVAVKQATTQDLSLPDDEFSSKNNQNKQPSALGRTAKQLGRSLLQPVNQVGGMTGGMTSKFMHF